MKPEPQLKIDLASPTPVYRQIVDQFRALLVEGALQPDDPLPSVRRIALDLGIHFNTVAEAYRLLADEGWLDVSHGKSVRVRRRETPAPNDAVAETFRFRLRQLIAEMRSEGLPPARIVSELQTLAEGMKSV